MQSWSLNSTKITTQGGSIIQNTHSIDPENPEHPLVWSCELIYSAELKECLR